MRVTVSDVSLSNLLAHDNAQDGIQLSSTDPPVFDAITANDNGAYGIRVNQNPGSVPGNLAGHGNGVSGIYLTGQLGGASPNGTWTWGASPDFPVVPNNLAVYTGDTLEVAAGAVVKYAGSAAYIYLAGGTLRTLGTAENPTWFTSLRDDTQGGDTNDDGGATLPAPGDHVGIYADSGSRLALNHTWLAYGGAGGWANIATTNGTAASIDWNGGGCLYSALDGLRVVATTVTLSDLCIAHNTGPGVTVSVGGASNATGCDIFANDVAGSRFGFRNITSATTIDATNCWWGDASGPYDPSNGPPGFNPGGLGDRVTDYVLYAPWATGPQTNQPPDGFRLLAPADGAALSSTSVVFTWRARATPTAAR